MAPIKTIKAVLFDLDGVLVDAREWHYESFNRALQLFGHEITRLEHEGYYNGLPTRSKLMKLSAEKNLPQALHDFIFGMKQRYTIECIQSYCCPEFSKQIMLKTLKEKGVKIAVCTNAIRSTMDLMLQRTFIDQYVDFRISNEDVHNHKPHPEMYHKAMDYFHVTPLETIIVEDSPHGIEAAERSGAHVIRVSGAHEVTISLFHDFFEFYS